MSDRSLQRDANSFPYFTYHFAEWKHWQISLNLRPTISFFELQARFELRLQTWLNQIRLHIFRKYPCVKVLPCGRQKTASFRRCHEQWAVLFRNNLGAPLDILGGKIKSVNFNNPALLLSFIRIWWNTNYLKLIQRMEPYTLSCLQTSGFYSFSTIFGKLFIVVTRWQLKQCFWNLQCFIELAICIG